MNEKLAQRQDFIATRKTYFSRPSGIKIVPDNYPELLKYNSFMARIKRERNNKTIKRAYKKDRGTEVEEIIFNLLSMSYNITGSNISYQEPVKNRFHKERFIETDGIVGSRTKPDFFIETKSISLQILNEENFNSLKSPVRKARKQINKIGALLISLNPNVRGGVIAVFEHEKAFNNLPNYLEYLNPIMICKEDLSKERLPNIIANGFNTNLLPFFAIFAGHLEAEITVKLQDKKTPPTKVGESVWDPLNDIVIES